MEDLRRTIAVAVVVADVERIWAATIMADIPLFPVGIAHLSCPDLRHLAAHSSNRPKQMRKMTRVNRNPVLLPGKKGG